MYETLGRLDNLSTKFESPRLADFSIAKEISPIRCVGNFGLNIVPIAHHKFVVLCRDDLPPWEKFADEVEKRGGKTTFPHFPLNEHRMLQPYAVWTGSFNFTKNATHSLENALLISESSIVHAYLEEYVFTFGLSEPLDWTIATTNPTIETVRCEACKQIQLIDRAAAYKHEFDYKNATGILKEIWETHYTNKYKKWCPICATVCINCDRYTSENYVNCLCCGKPRTTKVLS